MFIVKLSSSINSRLFFVVTVVTDISRLDSIFEVSEFQLSQERLIVGLFGVQAQRSYLLFVVIAGNKLQLRQKKIDLDEELEEARDLLMISWSVQFL